MATKCVAQMPEPALTPVSAAQSSLRRPLHRSAMEYMRNDVSAVATHTTTARRTSHASCSVTKQETTRYILITSALPMAKKGAIS